MLVSLTSRETAIGTNDPFRLTLGWLSSRKCSGHFQQKNQGIPTARDVIFRFAKQTITWGCFCTKCSHDPRVETQQIFGKVKVHETPHGKVQEWKMSTMKRPTPKLIQIVSRKNQNNSQKSMRLVRPSWTNPTATKHAAFKHHMFFSGNAVLIQRNPLPCPIYRGPLRISALLPTEPEKNPHRKRHKSPYDLQTLGWPKTNIWILRSNLHSFHCGKSKTVQNQPQGKGRKRDNDPKISGGWFFFISFRARIAGEGTFFWGGRN